MSALDGMLIPRDGEPTPVVTDSLLQGGIVSVYYLGKLGNGTAERL